MDYRLVRLRRRALVERTRPYAASGSAPFYWWLTRAGAHLVEGTSPAPGKGAPNPLFLRHTAAIAGLYVALLEVGVDADLELSAWRRDEDAWEDWSSSRSGTHPTRRPRRAATRRRRRRGVGRRVRRGRLRHHGPGPPAGQGRTAPSLLRRGDLVGPPSVLSGAAAGHDLRSPGEPVLGRRREGPSPPLPLRTGAPRPLPRAGGSVRSRLVARGGRGCAGVARKRRRRPFPPCPSCSRPRCASTAGWSPGSRRRGEWRTTSAAGSPPGTSPGTSQPSPLLSATRRPASPCATCSTAWSPASGGPTSTPTWQTPRSPGGRKPGPAATSAARGARRRLARPLPPMLARPSRHARRPARGDPPIGPASAPSGSSAGGRTPLRRLHPRTDLADRRAADGRRRPGPPRLPPGAGGDGRASCPPAPPPPAGRALRPRSRLRRPPPLRLRALRAALQRGARPARTRAARHDVSVLWRVARPGRRGAGPAAAPGGFPRPSRRPQRAAREPPTTDTGSNCRPQPSLRRPPAGGNDDCTALSQQIGRLPRHPRGRAGRGAPTTPPAGDSQDRLPRHPRGAASRAPASPPDAGAPGAGVHHCPRGDGKRGQQREHQAGGSPSRVHHHPRGGTDAGAEAAVPSPEALRPYARALVVLAIEVRAEGLALPGERRSHGPIGRGGGRCAA